MNDFFRSVEQAARRERWPGYAASQYCCQLTTKFNVFILEADMTRFVHPKKEVENALKHAEAEGWRIEVGGAHAWGKLYCPYKGDECRCGEFCISCVWCTPRNAGNHANALRRVVDNCATHMKHKAAMRLAPQGK